MKLNLSMGTGDAQKKSKPITGQITWDVLCSYIASRGLGENITNQIFKDLKKTPPTAYPFVVKNFNQYILRAQSTLRLTEQLETERMEASVATKEEFDFGKQEIKEQEQKPVE